MKPNIALVIGDPAGVGPELLAKLLADGEAAKHANIFVIGNHASITDAERATGTALNLTTIEQSEIGTRDFERPVLLSWSGIDAPAFTRGKAEFANGNLCSTC